MLHLIQHHGLEALVSYYAISAAISSLPSPTAKSTAFYQWFFRFSNAFGGNLARMWSTAVENSPNFTAAVEKQKD